MQSFKLNDFQAELDGQWQGSKVASDGNIYFFSSTHSGSASANFFRFSPTTGTVTRLISNLSLALGQTNTGWNPGQAVPQGKVHSAIVEHNGWLYAVGHLADESRRVDWGGSHAFGYNMQTGQVKDFGVLKTRYTSYSGISVDPARNYLYVYGTPAYATEINDPSANGGPHMFRYDLAAASAPYGKTDLGRINTTNPIYDNANFYQFTDSRGDTWFTMRNDVGALYKVPAGSTSYIRYASVLPRSTDPVSGAVTANYSYWGWAQPTGDGNKFLFTQWGAGGLWLFDADKMATDRTHAFSFIKHIGPTNLGVATDGENVYFTRQVTNLNNPNPHSAAVQGDANHLMGLDLDTLAITDWGLIEDQMGRRPWRVESMCADGEGHVYFSGDWYLLEDPARPGQPAETGTFRYDPATHLHDQTTRGQIFAVANVPEPAVMLVLSLGGLALLRRRRA